MRTLLGIMIAICSTALYAEEADNRQFAKLHLASASIEEHADYKKIEKSLYNQLGEEVLLPSYVGKTGQPSEHEVREFLRKYYIDTWVVSYKNVYEDFVDAKMEFSECDQAKPVNEKEEVLKTICIHVEEENIRVRYFVNAFSRGWEEPLNYVFAKDNKSLKLVDIELLNKEELHLSANR